jgi:TetR/AcrR family transcriptional repressor of nem operon
MHVPTERRSKRQQILDVAGHFVQTAGYGSFSYHDLARRVGIKTASIHYHFPVKGDLGQALMSAYRKRFQEALAAVDRGASAAPGKLRRFAELFRETIEAQQKVCMGGMLASEAVRLPSEVTEEVAQFFEEVEGWLAGVLAEGRREGTLSYAGTPAAAARTLFAALEGAMLTAHCLGQPGRFREAARWLLTGLEAAR